jgi:chromosome segregation ATPase
MIKRGNPLDLIRRADQQLNSLQIQIDHAMAEISQGQARIQQLGDQARQRALDLATKERGLQAASAHWDQARSYAELAQGTAQESETIASLKQAQALLKQAQADFEQLKTRDAREQGKEQAVIDAARAAILAGQTALSNLQAKHADIVGAREQAWQERGAMLIQNAQEAIQAMQTQIEIHRRAVIDAQVEFEQLCDEQAELLADYPDLQREVQALRTTSDATSRVIASAISYIDVLLANRLDLATNLSLPAIRLVSPWWDLLTIPSDELWKYQNIRSNTSLLSGRREKLRQLLAEYKGSKKS